MRACIQRVSRAKVTVRPTGEVTGQIGRGFLILLGVGREDTEKEARLLIRKIAGLRVFDDSQGRMNLSLADCGGELLVVSQFTLYAQCKKGNRPSFTEAAPPERAQELYRFFVGELQAACSGKVEEGRFQAEMDVALVNDGPLTIWLDTDYL
ncbi:MAG: D-tyrosyl-tRNA(Tyr) deacylase [Thermoguttaceae bacterium]|nr:D-tyrosyl-tRNA(Tyr) deacylase [Thermoguttaceae bacterium]